MLAISTIPSSLAASSSSWASSGCSISAAGEGFCLPSPADTYELLGLVPCCADPGMTSPVVGGGLTLLSLAASTVSQVSSSSWSTESEGGMSCDNISSTVRTQYS
jgi:hypothetical protein